MNLGWFGSSLVSLSLLVPIWLAIGYFDRNLGIKSDVFLIWYFPGVIVTTILFGQSPVSALVPSGKFVAVIFLVGLLAGGLANILLFRAVATAPNPGLPLAVNSLTSVGVFLVAICLARLVPSHFNQIRADPWSFLGVLLAVAGVSLIAIRR